MRDRQELTRTTVWIPDDIYYLFKQYGIPLNTFVNRCVREFLGIAPDPTQKLIKEKTAYSVRQVKEKYDNEAEKLIQKQKIEESIQDQVKQKEYVLIQLGEWIQKRPEYPNFQSYFIHRDYDDDVLYEVHSKYEQEYPGRFSDKESFWNALINWHNKYGQVVN